MDYRFSENEQMFADTLTRFAREQLLETGAEADRQAVCPDDVINKGLEMGMFLDAIPEAQGGYLEGAYSHTERAVRVLAMARGCPGLTTVFEANTEVALGAAALGESALAAVASLVDPTQARGCLVLSRAGNPVKFMDGTLSGSAGGVPNAIGATLFLVVGLETDSTPFVALVSGATVEAQGTMGLRAAGTGTVSLDGAQVVAAVTGADAAPLVSKIRNAHRVFAGALGVGSAEIALEHAEGYAADRIQFGQPILKFESLARLIHENRGRLAAARHLVFAAAQALDSEASNASELCRQASAFAGEAAVRAAIDAVQVYGGYGFVNDYPVEKIMRDVRACTTLAGDGLREAVLATAAA